MKNILPALALLLTSSFASAAAVGGKDFTPDVPTPLAGSAVKSQSPAGAVAPSKKPKAKRAVKKAVRAARA